MCNQFCLSFVYDNMPSEAVAGLRVLEVGAYDVNGTCRKDLIKHLPSLYFGVDMRHGPNVDAITNVYELEYRFGKESFDVVVNTEMMEHVTNWREAINNMKSVIKVGGYLALTTRSIGFGYHGFPVDWWRFSLENMAAIFSDYKILALQTDPLAPGIGIVAQKIQSECRDLTDYEVFMMEQPEGLPKTPPPLDPVLNLCNPLLISKQFL